MSRTLGAPLAIGDAEIVPLIEQRSSTFTLGGRLVWHGERRPVGIVVRRAGGAVRAFLIDGRECDAATLVGDFPALADWIDSMPVAPPPSGGVNGGAARSMRLGNTARR